MLEFERFAAVPTGLWRVALLVLLGAIAIVAVRQATSEHGYGLSLLVFGIYMMLLYRVVFGQ
jgi:hypothetical protein